MNNTFNNVNEVLHRIKVKLYPNYLPGVPGAFFARTNNEAALSIEEVCATAKNRSGYTGNYEDLNRNMGALLGKESASIPSRLYLPV